jgi:hypothetical protein
MRAPYYIRSEFLSVTLPAGVPTRVTFDCWRVRIFLGLNANGVFFNGVPFDVLAATTTPVVVELGGAMAGDRPVPFIDVIQFLSSGGVGKAIVIVREYMVPA